MVKVVPSAATNPVQHLSDASTRHVVNRGVGPRSLLQTQPGGGLLLCCVCQEQSTTYRYEVVYKASHHHLHGTSPQQVNGLCVTQLPNNPAIALNGNKPTSGQQQLKLKPRPQSALGIVRPRPAADGCDDSNEHAYYNFPPRHPRHGHLKWPVWNPRASVAGGETLSLTYPDYPVHIPTTTLKRVTLAERKNKKSGISKQSETKKVPEEAKSEEEKETVTKKEGRLIQNQCMTFESAVRLRT